MSALIGEPQVFNIFFVLDDGEALRVGVGSFEITDSIVTGDYEVWELNRAEILALYRGGLVNLAFQIDEEDDSDFFEDEEDSEIRGPISAVLPLNNLFGENEIENEENTSDVESQMTEETTISSECETPTPENADDIMDLLGPLVAAVAAFICFLMIMIRSIMEFSDEAREE